MKRQPHDVRGKVVVRFVLTSALLLLCSNVLVAQESAPPTSTSTSGATQEACKKLSQVSIPHITITSAQEEAAGPVPVPQRPSISAPARCVIRAISRPTSDSEITIEVWLPIRGWNKRYLQTGNGGWAGSIQTANLAYATQRGYAAASTDDGHQGGQDASFVVGHPEKLIDFAYRALRETAVVAKTLIATYYRQSPAHSYFNGCSDGGREALMEAQRFPEEFDGILAGAPANNWSRIGASHLWDVMAQTASAGSAIPPSKLAAIHTAVLAACDAKDGLRDGIISDPRSCHFDPAVLECKTTDLPECLTKPQVEALQKIYAGPRNPVSGVQIFPGYEPGTETAPGSWPGWIVADAPEHSIQYVDATTTYRQSVFEDTPWNWQTMDFDKDIAIADQKLGTVVNSMSPDLRSFRDHGGKLIQYHGWGDATIAPVSSIDYYERAGEFLAKYPDPRSPQSSHELDFYRLFMVPGLSHCFNGIGAVNFGQLGATGAVGRGDPERDILAALVRWVEEGDAPDKIIAIGVSPNDPTQQISRPLYPYPRVSQYKGQGDPNNAESFSGVEP